MVDSQANGPVMRIVYVAGNIYIVISFVEEALGVELIPSVSHHTMR